MFGWFEIACVVVVVATLVSFSRHRPTGELLGDYAALAVGGFLGEETCISWYRYYEYSASWHLRLDHVPLLIPLIWPLVILSASDVARALFPHRRGVARAALVAMFVVFDAALVELLSVRAGFWRWAEPGYAGVPLIGILGWGFFGFGAELARANVASTGRRMLAIVLLAPLTAHALILASWWVLFRHRLRGDLGIGATIAHVTFAIGLAVCAFAARRRGDRMTSDIWGPRLAATAIFGAVFVATSITSLPHAVALAATALPYLIALRLGKASTAQT